MIKDEVIENLVSEVEEDSHRSKIKQFLNGEIDNFLDINKKSLKFVNNFKMENYMEEDVFFESETGEILLKYFRYMYNNFPNELSYQFSNFPLKYKIFKLLNFSEEFVKKDFENNLEMKNKTVFVESCKYFLNYFENLADEYVENYKKYCDNFLLKIGILIIIRNNDNKNSEEIKKLENIFVNYIKNKIDKYNINEIFEKYLDNGNFTRYFINVEALNLEKSRKYVEKIFFLVLKKNISISKVISEGIELFIMFSEIEFSSTNNNYYYRNKIFDNLKKIFKKYSFSHGQKLYLLVNYGTNVIFYNFDYSKKMYDLFLDTIKENVINSKAFFKDNLKGNKIIYLFLLHFFIKYDLIDEKEKSKFLVRAENILISNLKKLFKPKVWKWKSKEFKNLEFLKKDKIDWKNIKVQCLRNKDGKALVQKDTIVFSLLKYSEMYKKAFQFFVNGVEKIDLFTDIFERYSVIYDMNDLKLILDEMWDYNLSINFINQEYFEYIAKTGCENENNKIWIEFLHRHEKELYKSFGNDAELKNVEKYVEILYSKDNNFDYFQLPKLLLKADKNTGQKIEKILRKKPEIRKEVEKLLENTFAPAVQIARNLIRYWNNVEAQRELKNLTNPKEIFEYSENICLKKHEENAIFSSLVDYGMIRIRKSEEKVPEKLMKFYISEYILENDIKTIEVCNKIEQIVDRSDLRKFIAKIFQKWKEHRFNPKYKNIFIPLILTSNIKIINDNMISIIDTLVSEYNKVAVAAYGIRVLALRNETKEIGILVKGFLNNYKDKRIKMTSDQTLDIIARNGGITRDELNDILIPNFEFGQDRTRTFDYGERKI